VDHRRSERDREILPDPVATRVLARASELEALRVAGASVAELRAAALEAGISESAFEEALGEIQRAEDAGSPDVRRPIRTRVRIAAAVVALALILTGIFASRMVVPAAATQVAETFTLRCIPANEAASMLRPVLVQTGTISFSMRIPTELTITGTPQQLEQARSILAEQDVPGSASCAAR
jgi:type II secretory pathway component GspD/PulD (secretin)